MSDTANESHGDRLAAAQQRIVSHPGYLEKERYDGLARLVYAVLLPNRDALVSLLNQPSRDPDLAVELFQNMWRPDARIRFEGDVTRALLNYVASAGALVDHTRRIMRGRAGSIVDEFERRKAATIERPEVLVVQGLRNYVLHRALPLIGHEVRIQPQPGAAATGEVRLSTRQLLEWERWAPQARHFILSAGEVLILRPVVEVHGELAEQLNLWLYGELAAANAPALAKTNELIDERNAILGGIGVEEARRIGRDVTARRLRPRPSALSEEKNLS